MAISGGDGSIILTTKVDTSGIEKGTNKIKNATQKMNSGLSGIGVQLSKSFSQNKGVAKFERQLEKTNETIDKASKKFEELRIKADEIYASAFRGPNGDIVFKQGDEARLDKINAEMNELEQKIESNKIKAQELGDAIKRSSRGNVPAVKAVTKGIDNFGKRVAGLAKRVFVFTLILRALRAILDVVKNVAMGDEEFAKSLEQLKAALWVAFTPILNVIVPALKNLVDWLTRAVVAIGKFFAAISGKSYESMVQNAKGLKQQSENYKKLGKSAKDAKKQLAGFDDIQILSSDSSADAGESSSDVFSKFNGDSEINSIISSIMGIVGGAMLALGVLLLFYGQIGWGIGLIIAGATTMGINIANIADSDLGIAEKFSSIMSIVGGFILALGLVLFFKCLSPVGKSIGLGMIIAGAGVLAVSAAQMAANNIGGEIGNLLHGIIAVVSGFLLVIGLIMMFSGNITPLSIGLVITGAIGLASEVALYPNAVKESLRGWLGAILAIVGAALLVLGIILCCTTGPTPISIGLILAGAAALITPIALNWNAIVDWVKKVWDKIKEFWNTYVAPIFTAKWWADLGKKALNGLIGIVEKGLNYLIDKINVFVRGIDKVVSAVGEIFGADWSFAQIPNVRIPRLARGAVIPPNKEFLAVLGDQKQGVNIEAPLQTIVDAFNIALAQNGGAGAGKTEVVLEIDGREFGRAVVEQGNKENRRIGTRLVMA